MGLKALLLSACVALGMRTAAAFTTGHDLSSAGYMEKDKGVTWYTAAGKAAPLETILGAGGMQSVRLRLWTGSEYGLDYTLALAKRFSAAGYSIYLDMHFSDTWADAGAQKIPSSWKASNIEVLASSLRTYVKSTLRSFTAAGIKLEILALGNEITGGMLYPLGRIQNNDFKGFAKLWAAARAGVEDAVAAGTSRPKVMIHLDNGWKKDTVAWFFQSLFATGVVKKSDVDVFGFSFYPFYDTRATVSALSSSLWHMANAYGKPIYVSETNYPTSCTKVKLSANYPTSAAGQIQWTKAVINVLRSLPKNLGAGIYYWEPAYVSTPGLGSQCEAALLFSVDWSTYPKTKAKALSSVSLYK
uniref:arabinogalactan endo-beta-1,4-galactanase n=1 Tax=Globisporangium ultimum (strain ATCC 200006 / CBS 805.95 / DAOM BR144) TaxID=431595 RepID=K3WHT9_GLOUD